MVGDFFDRLRYYYRRLLCHSLVRSVRYSAMGFTFLFLIFNSLFFISRGQFPSGFTAVINTLCGQ